MELGTRLDVNSFVGEAVCWPLFHIYAFGQISLIFEKLNPLIYLNNYIYTIILIKNILTK